MGAACCVAAKDRTIPERSSCEIVHRNVRYSPSWSFRWDNRGRVAGEVETSLSSFSGGLSRNNGLEIKSATREDSPYISEVGSPLESLQTPISQKSLVSEEATGNIAAPVSADQSISRTVSFEVKESTDCPVGSDLSPIKLSLASSTSSVSASPLSSKPHLPPAGSIPSRWPHHSPGHQILRQASDGRIRGPKSPNNYPISEGKPSLLPAWSNESTRASHGGSSDSWSMQVFSELMVSSQRERRWSFDSESMGDKITRSSSRKSSSPSLDLQTCGVCSKLLTEKSSWSTQKIIANNELSVVAVLICGHVYHAECLENMTPETNKYDPACPVCTLGEKQTLKLCEKALKAEIECKAKATKRSRNRVVDSDFDSAFIKFDHHKSSGREGKGPKMGSSSSMKPFLKRHFSFGSKGMRSFSENQNTRKKGFFWTRSSKE